LRHLIRGKQMVKCSKAEVRRLKTALRWKIPAPQRQRIQMVLLRESGMTQPAIAAAMGVSLSTVNRAHMETRAFRRGLSLSVAPATTKSLPIHPERSRVLRYAMEHKTSAEPLAAFIQRKGGINKCAARFTRCVGTGSNLGRTGPMRAADIMTTDVAAV
jgi:transposase